MKKSLLFLLASFFSITGLQAQREVLIYDLYANKVKMGKWEVSKTIEADLTIYESHREVVFKFLKAHRTETIRHAVFRNDTLLESNVEVIVNGEKRRSFQTVLRGADYFYQEEGKPVRQLESPVIFTDLSLFFGMPKEAASVYIDREGGFLPLRTVDKNSCVVTLPNGEENQYHFLDGRLTRATLEEGILHTYLRLRKQKEQGTVGR